MNRRTCRRRWFTHVAVGLLAALIIGGCGFRGDSSPTAEAVASPTTIPALPILTPTPGPPPQIATTATSTEQVEATPTAQPQEQASSYVVQPGDTLFGIAVRFNVSIEALSEANGIVDQSTLQVGQVLVIPTSE